MCCEKKTNLKCFIKITIIVSWRKIKIECGLHWIGCMQNWIVLNMKCGAGVENIMGGWKNKTVLKISLHQCVELEGI